jgi:hypothetical protein
MIQEAELGKRIQQQLYSDWKLCQGFSFFWGNPSEGVKKLALKNDEIVKSRLTGGNRCPGNF